MITGDTIVAVSSAAGAGARAVVRLSGPAAVAVAGRLFTPARGELRDVPGFCAADGLLRLTWHGRPAHESQGHLATWHGRPAHASQGHLAPVESDSPDTATGETPVGRMGKMPMPRHMGGTPMPLQLPCWAYVFRAPRSYTRQDLIELHIPGSPVLAGMVLDAAVAMGARLAGPGEFTARAFLSGRLDLAQAQAVADVIDAADDASLRAALSALKGRIGQLARQNAAALTEALATVEASIDLADEGIELDSPAELARRLAELAQSLHRTAADAADTPDRSRAPTVVLAGPPNVGKSSLLNALAGVDRAIVSAVAGTTRDVLTADMVLDGRAAILIDAAGLALPADTLDAAAQDAARAAVASADVIVFVTDLTVPTDASMLAELCAMNRRAAVVLVGNKADLAPSAASASWRVPPGLDVAVSGTGVPPVAAVTTSAVTGAGLERLRKALTAALHCEPAAAAGPALHQAQRQSLRSAADATMRAAELLQASAHLADRAELVAAELRLALNHLALLAPSGEHGLAEDVLASIFARFCVGK